MCLYISSFLFGMAYGMSTYLLGDVLFFCIYYMRSPAVPS